VAPDEQMVKACLYCKFLIVQQLCTLMVLLDKHMLTVSTCWRQGHNSSLLVQVAVVNELDADKASADFQVRAGAQASYHRSRGSCMC